MVKAKNILAAITLGATLLLPSFSFAAGPQTAASGLVTDGQTAAGLGLLIGDGQGVNTDYLAKGTTRVQAAIISLRLQGKLDQAEAFAGTDNFSDANLVNAGNQKILAFLHANPAYGWIGEAGNRFAPLSKVSSQQMYKVLLEVIGYKSGKDFDYKDTETFAAEKGLNQIDGVSELTNAHVATALIESLAAATPEGQTLFGTLQSAGIIAASAVLPAGERITLRTDAKLGRYLADGEGRTLYSFSNDVANLDACQGACLANWPFLDSDQLQLPAGLNPADFTLISHADGTKQWAYKGWPLYRFKQDSKAGDTLGEGVNGVWFAAKPDYSVKIGANAALGKYLTDAEGRTLYYFAKDMPQMSMCTGSCLAAWPAFTDKGAIPSTLNAADFGSITRPDGSKQTTYKGYPLYYYINDKQRGDTTGQNVGQVWFVVNPDSFGGAGSNASMPAMPAAGMGTEPADQPQQPSEQQPSSPAAAYTVNIKDLSFGAPLTVEAGSKVTFTNQDDMQHSAVARDGSFATPVLAKGESYTITLDKPGTYDYYCQIHSFMTGQIIVK